MKRLMMPIAFALVLAAVPARAQVRLHIDLGLPVAPPLVVVQPGVQVVEGFGDEVFFHLGWYWCRRPDGWYRARGPRDRFSRIEQRRVPGVLLRSPEGHYRNWHHEGPRPQDRRDAREIRRDDRRQDRREDRKRREERKEDRREERREDRREEHGRGH